MRAAECQSARVSGKRLDCTWWREAGEAERLCILALEAALAACALAPARVVLRLMLAAHPGWTKLLRSYTYGTVKQPLAVTASNEQVCGVLSGVCSR